MNAPAEARLAPTQLDEATLRALVEAAFDALVIAHAGRVVFANRSFCEMSGWTLEEIRGRSVMDFVAEESRALVLAKMTSGERGRYEARGLCRDGTTIAVEICARECDYQGQPARITAIRYIEDRRRAEEALRRSEARLRGVIERLPDMIVVHRAGVVVFANPSVLSYVGATRLDELVGRPLADMVHPDEREAAIERVRTTFEEQVAGPLQSFRVLRGDGKYGVLEVASAPIDFDGEPAVLVIARDVSERKELEARLVQADLLASMGMLAAGLTHEINNPLAYILLNLDLLSNRVRSMLKHTDGGGEVVAREREALGQEITRLLADTRDGAGRVQRIVHDFRVFARGGDGRPKLLDLREVLDSTVKLTQNELRHRARLTRDYQPVPLVNADEARLGQLFLNLLMNALQALPMDAGPEATEIRVTTRTAADGSALVDIADNGGGIPRDQLERVFEPVFTGKPAEGGAGLGLSICRSIVIGLGGSIEIESEPGGTLCRVLLPPATHYTGPPEREPRPLSPASDRRPRLLLIDDEERLLCAIADQLSVEFEVESTASGDAAIDILIERDFDAVVCDLMMPGTSGADVYEAARGHRPGIEKRFIFMTGGAFTTSTRRFLQTVDSPRLDKPFDVAELSAMVRRVLAER